MPSLATPITSGVIRNHFPELIESSFDDALLDEAGKTAMAIDSTSEQRAVYLAAHFAVVFKNENTAEMDGGSGVIVTEQVGPRMAVYANMTARDSKGGSMDVFYERSSYGRIYLSLRSASARRVMPLVVS